MNEQRLSTAFLRGRGVRVAVYEIVDDANLVRRGKSLNRAFAQVVADRRNSVGLLDGEFRNRKIRRISTNERNIRPMQGRNKGQAAPGSQHLLRQQRRDRVRN